MVIDQSGKTEPMLNIQLAIVGTFFPRLAKSRSDMSITVLR